MITTNQLISYLKKAADFDGMLTKWSNGVWGGAKRWGYVWGMNGDEYTKDIANKYHAEAKSGKRSVPSTRNRNSYYIGDCTKWIGNLTADCSGLLVGAQRSINPKFGDMSSGSWIQQCTKTSTTMSSIPNEPGIILWKNGHVGVYISDNTVIESRGTDYGVVVSPISSQKWAKWGYSKHIDYGKLQDKPAAGWHVDRVLKLTPTMMRGDDVKELQTRLQTAGCNPGKIDGVFGKNTEAAVTMYQSRNGLTVDGKVGKNTITKLGGAWDG